jgi:hypothetical protein
VRTTSPGRAAYRYQRPSWRRPLIVLIVIALLLGGAVYAAYTVYERYVLKILTVPGCQAGSGANAMQLDFGQAADAATIAGVAVRERLPQRAVTIAYATAMQESKLENLSYGDLDSVGIFQQRPSQGWGTATQLQDPAYAAGAFYHALVRVSGWQRMAVDDAAQAVQHSADGSAYQQYASSGATLASFYIDKPHAVTCWYTPADQAASQGVSAKQNLSGATKKLTETFGAPGGSGALTRVSRARSGSSGKEALRVRTDRDGWAVANWLVTNASSYGITQVSYAGYRWKATLTETSWQADPGAVAGGIVAS